MAGRSSAFLLSLCAGVLANAGTGGELVLTERGAVPRYTVVLPEAPSPSQVTASRELVRYVREITGVTLPVATNVIKAYGIYLGNGAADFGHPEKPFSSIGSRSIASGRR